MNFSQNVNALAAYSDASSSHLLGDSVFGADDFAGLDDYEPAAIATNDGFEEDHHASRVASQAVAHDG